GRSASTRRSTRRSNGSHANGSDSKQRRARRRSSSGTATPSCCPPLRCSPRRSTGSRPRSDTSRAPRYGRSRSHSHLARRGRRRCRTSETRSRPSGSAASRASYAQMRWSGSRTSRSGTSATSRTPPPSASCCPTRSSRSTTCSSASRGWSRASSCDPSGCSPTSMPGTGSSSASDYSPRSSRAGCPGTLPTGRGSDMRCAPGRRGSTSGGSRARTPTRPQGSTSTACSRWTPTPLTFRRCSTACVASSQHDRLRCMPEALHLGNGKVRDLYALGDDRLLLVASDRISTFDVVLPTEIPDKGRVLTGLSAFWFARTRHLVPNHLVALREDGSSLECRRLEMLPVEVVVRGYLAGSGWTDYLASGEVGGTRIPSGLRESDRLPEPIVTPATKATEGHDVNITERDAEDLCGRARYRAAREAALAVYRFVARHAEQRGILLADTKFEFGVDGEGVVTLADEAVTPDSSRFWPASEYATGGP